MSINLAQELFNRIRINPSKHVVIIGDAMVDRWVRGYLAPCQDGCRKFVQKELVEVPGGAANAERCLSKWRVRTSLYGFSPEHRPVKTRYLAQSEDGGAIIFRADDDKVATANYRWVYDLALEMVGCASAVLLSDYDKGFLTPNFIREVVTHCLRRGVPCVADCKREPEVYCPDLGCILKCNYEYSMSPDAAFQADVITHGALPPFVNGNVGPNCLPRVECVNHVGAGDCFAAHLVLGLAYGLSLEDSATLAHSAGRVYVQHPNNYPPSPEEVAVDLIHLDVISTKT